MLLDKTASVWRKVSSANTFVDTQVYTDQRCTIVPISRLDMVSPFAYESSHLIWVPYWLVLRKEDQVRYGRRPPDAFGDIVSQIYVINGRRPFSQGIPQIAYYAREQN